MANMDALRTRYAEAKQADVARNTLLDDLFQKVDDMQKTMDRNAFVMVLIDGDCMNFQNELVKGGVSGGDEAAKLLRQAVFDYLRYDENFKHDHKIVIRVYASLRGLSKTYAEKGILPNTAAFSEFVLGFNKAHPLCDFIDAGNHKEAADTKLKEILSLYVYNVHCKQIIFGASADNGYASFLSSFFIGTDVSSRIRLLKGPPFSFEFKSVLPKFRWTEFNNVFRSDFISAEPLQHHGPRRVPEVEPQTAHESFSGSKTHSSSTPWSAQGNSELYATRAATSDTVTLALGNANLPSRPKKSGVEQYDDPNGVAVSNVLQYVHSRTVSRTSSSSPPQSGHNARPTANDVAAALISSTYERLHVSPKALDFGVVKQMVEEKLGLTFAFWGKDDRDEWFSKSKNIIKMAVEEWVETTGNSPPKNATWMLRYFASGQSPSAVMRSASAKLWRTRVDLDVPIPDPSDVSTPITGTSDTPNPISSPNRNTSITPTNDRESPSCIFQNRRGQRIDVPKELHVAPVLFNELKRRNPRLCNSHHLLGSCTNIFCPYDHNSILSDHEFGALLSLSRSQRCPQGSACTDPCFKGHMCPNGRSCRHGNDCRFSDLHGIDTAIVTELGRSQD